MVYTRMACPICGYALVARFDVKGDRGNFVICPIETDGITVSAPLYVTNLRMWTLDESAPVHCERCAFVTTAAAVADVAGK